MKQISPDKTFIYYYWKMMGGGYAGLRLDRLHAYVIKGSASEPAKLAVQGEPFKLPIREPTSEGFKNVKGQLVDTHPELEALLAGQTDFDEALS